VTGSPKKKWQRPKLRVFCRSDSEVRALETCSQESLPCTNPANTSGKCYKIPACRPAEKRGHDTN
jgi:hypothetical protein